MTKTTPSVYNTQIMRETTSQQFPPLYMEVFVVGDDSEQRAFAEMFVRADCTRAESIEKADLVVFTGGEDVDPSLYGENKHPMTFSNLDRDQEEINIYEKCLDLGIPMFGVCRGAQFLHVMNGGRLFQHVDNHNGNHQMWDLRHNKMIEKVSSVHHQMCIKNPEGGMEVIGLSGDVSGTRWFDDKEFESGKHSDIEAFFYRDTCCFGVQGHPEYRGYSEFLMWTLNMMDELIVMNPDLELKNNLRRMKPALIEERTNKWIEANQASEMSDNEPDLTELAKLIAEETN